MPVRDTLVAMTRLVSVLTLLLTSAVSFAAPRMSVFAPGGLVTDGGSYDFGSASIGDKQPRWFTIRNRGDAPLWIGGITFTGPYQIVGDVPSTVAPGADAIITIRWVPSGEGSNPGSVRIVNNDAANNPFNISFSATSDGLPPLPEINVFSGGVGIQDGTSFDFGTATSGTPVKKWITVRNKGDAPLTLGTPVFTGPFSLVGTAPSTVAAGTDVNLTVRWIPGSGGIDRGTMMIPNNDANENPFDIVLRGTAQAGAGPEIKVFVQGSEVEHRDTVEFGAVSIGSTRSRSLIIRNTGEGVLDLGTPVLPQGFTISPALPPVVRASSQFTTSITWAPTATGATSGVLKLTTNDADENPFKLVLHGTANSGSGTNPEIAMFISATQLQDGDTYDFGSADVGETKSAWLTLRNKGGAPLHLTYFNTSGPFTVPDDVPTTIAAQTDIVLTLKWKPTSEGQNTGTIRILSDDADESQFDVALVGEAGPAGPSPEIEVVAQGSSTVIENGGTFDYGTGIRQFSQRQWFTIRNKGDASLQLGAATFSGTFQLALGFSDNVAPGSVHTAIIDWVPYGFGENVGKVTFPTNDSDENPFVINLRGYSVAPRPGDEGGPTPSDDPSILYRRPGAVLDGLVSSGTGSGETGAIGSGSGLASSRGSSLAWEASPRASEYYVYLGTSESLNGDDLIVLTPSTSVGSVVLEPGTDYFWRVDAVNGGGVTRGAVMSFRTACRADLNLSGSVDIDDVLTLAEWVGDQDTRGDIDHSGSTDTLDIAAYLGMMGEACGAD